MIVEFAAEYAATALDTGTQVCRLAAVLSLSAIESAREPVGNTKLGRSRDSVALPKPEFARTELFNTGLSTGVTLWFKEAAVEVALDTVPVAAAVLEAGATPTGAIVAAVRLRLHL